MPPQRRTICPPAAPAAATKRNLDKAGGDSDLGSRPGQAMPAPICSSWSSFSFSCRLPEPPGRCYHDLSCRAGGPPPADLFRKDLR